MRQAVIIALVVAFTAPFVPVVHAEQVESKLPACCRREGRHKCGMTKAEHSKPETQSVTGVKAPCPSYPQTASVAAAADTFALSGPVETLQQQPPSYLKSASQTEILFHIAFSRSRQKRGPPSLHS